MNNEDRITQMIADMHNDIRSQLQKIGTRFDNIESRLDKFEGRFNGVESRLDNIENRLDNLEQATSANTAKLDEIVKFQKEGLADAICFLYDKTATKDDLNASMQALNDRLFNQEVEIKRLKLVK